MTNENRSSHELMSEYVHVRAYTLCKLYVLMYTVYMLTNNNQQKDNNTISNLPENKEEEARSEH